MSFPPSPFVIRAPSSLSAATSVNGFTYEERQSHLASPVPYNVSTMSVGNFFAVDASASAPSSQNDAIKVVVDKKSGDDSWGLSDRITFHYADSVPSQQSITYKVQYNYDGDAKTPDYSFVQDGSAGSPADLGTHLRKLLDLNIVKQLTTDNSTKADFYKFLLVNAGTLSTIGADISVIGTADMAQLITDNILGFSIDKFTDSGDANMSADMISDICAWFLFSNDNAGTANILGSDVINVDCEVILNDPASGPTLFGSGSSSTIKVLFTR